MTKIKIAQRIANAHNSLVNVMVSGDSAIIMGGVLVDLRKLVDELQRDIEEAEAADGGGGEAEV